MLVVLSFYMVDYPYGRHGVVSMYSEERAETLKEITGAAQPLDNEYHKDGDTIHLYEAPIEQDPERGYYSVWIKEGEQYIQTKAVSGDDGMIYEVFNDAR